MSSNKFFLKGALQDSYWVGISVMKSVDVMAFQDIKATREVYYEHSANYEMKILSKSTLDKALIVHRKTTDDEQP